tara:strand:+ start:3849 stop:4841 length:993 start_codon:yes stop_codon:yes gene_type:complete
MIKSRKSEDHLHTGVILSKISEYDIFRYYCPFFVECDDKFCSGLREDKSPSACITVWKGRLLYKDFAYTEHTFDCFNYVRQKFSCSFVEALTIIDTDFNLGLTSKEAGTSFTMGYMASITNKKPVAKKVTIIKKKVRPWSLEDKVYWEKYLITKNTLTIFGVTPINYYWINESRFSCDATTYAYQFGSKYKIYSPNDERKWVSNTTNRHIQGYKQLPATGDVVVLTSSLKDVMCLYEMGLPAIALQSEMIMPDSKLITHLKERFTHVFVLYDNDFTNADNPGQTMAMKICNEYSLPNVEIPTECGYKDVSDLIAGGYSFEDVKNLLIIQE